ncbi:MAG: hypothetical protein M3247_08020 [Thermoproteota archaeon]|nr:hypothetical protein [Thermoproteota archaeon]
MALADLVDIVLSDYGTATGSAFELIKMPNLANWQGIEMNNITTNMSMRSYEQMQMSGNSSKYNTMTRRQMLLLLQ